MCARARLCMCACMTVRIRKHGRTCVGAYARTVANTRASTRTYVFLHARVPLHNSRDRYMRTLVPSLSLSLSRSFSLLPPSLPVYRFFFRSHPRAFPSSVLLSVSLYPPPLPPTALFKYPLPNFLLSLCFSLLHSLPLLLPAFVSFYSVRSLSVFPKLLPLSLAIAYTVEAAQAAEGHRSQLWTYLDRRAKSEVWTSFARRPCPLMLGPRGSTIPMRRRRRSRRTFAPTSALSSARAKLSQRREKDAPVSRLLLSVFSFFFFLLQVGLSRVSVARFQPYRNDSLPATEIGRETLTKERNSRIMTVVSFAK